MKIAVIPINANTRPKIIWQQLDLTDQQKFLKRLKFFWEKARHRVPNEHHNFIDELITDRLVVALSGTICSTRELKNSILVQLNCDDKPESITVQRIINCTSPESDIKRHDSQLIKHLCHKKVIMPSQCGIGISADTKTFGVICGDGKISKKIYTIGNTLKGVLWESTAVPELRVQAYQLAKVIVEQINNEFVEQTIEASKSEIYSA